MSSVYRTQDLNQSAWLWTVPGAKLKNIEAVNPSTAVFVFEIALTETELQALLLQYANGEALVEPIALCTKQGQLRNLLRTSLSKREQHGS